MSEIDTLVAKLRQNPQELDKFLDQLAKPEPTTVEVKGLEYRDFNSPRSQRRIKQILAVIDKRGFAGVGEIRDDIGAQSNGGIYNYLNYLVETGTLVREDKSRYAAYFRPGTDIKAARVAKRTAEKKQSSREVEVAEKILAYASKHNGERYSVGMMADEIGEGIHTCYKAATKLKQRGLLDAHYNQGPNPHQSETAVATSDVKVAVGEVPTPEEFEPVIAKNEVCAIDKLVWAFVRETRSTDILVFLTWLENRNK